MCDWGVYTERAIDQSGRVLYWQSEVEVCRAKYVHVERDVFKGRERYVESEICIKRCVCI